MVTSVRCLIDAEQRLAKKKADLGHGRFLPWLSANAEALGFGERTSQLLMKGWAMANTKPASDLTETTALQISREIWGHKQSVLYHPESVEWYTPARYIEAVRECLGEIALDPASCAEANKVVRAKQFWTKKDKPLERDWFGPMFLNPPYGTDNGDSVAGMFCTKALAEYDTGNITEGIILVNSLHSQAWQAPLYSQPICFVDHRIKFVSGNGEENKNPTMSNIFVYLGRDDKKFIEVFSSIGFVMLPAAMRRKQEAAA
jgi:DNA N-6-adenine-methyltransferase (Dam)